jgi:uncharacterized protein (TIGR00106 family)
MKYQINASIQIIPSTTRDNKYELVDAAIEVIQKSGLRYQVTPLETIVEGDYDEVMKVFKEAQQATLTAGSEEIIVFIKLHAAHERDIRFEEKTEKWDLD